MIELIMVIVILGILAATALPKFVDLSTEAKVAKAQGVIGAISSSAVIQRSASLVKSGVTYTSSAACTGTYLEGATLPTGCTSVLGTACTVTCDGQAASAVLP